jgi:hypothetical protein
MIIIYPQNQHKENLKHTTSFSYLKCRDNIIKKPKKAGGSLYAMSQVVEHPPSKHEALSSNPGTAPLKNQRTYLKEMIVLFSIYVWPRIIHILKNIQRNIGTTFIFIIMLLYVHFALQKK